MTVIALHSSSRALLTSKMLKKVGAPLIAAIAAIILGLLLSPLSRQYPIFTWLARFDDSLIGLIPSLSPPQPSWGYTFDQLQHVDLRGQVALVTGGNSGIGFEISKALSRRGASVTLGCRSPQRCFKAVDEIRSDKLYSGAPVSPLIIDMSKLIKVQHAAKTFSHTNDKLDMLFLNAGIFQDESNPLSDDGIETTFATNVVGHHLLYRLLEPLLLNSTMARVVSTSSLAGLQFPFLPLSKAEIQITTSVQELNDWKPAIVFNWRPEFIRPFFKYGRSKLAQVLWSKALTRRLGKDSSIYVNAANPGAVKTPMTTHKYAHPMTPKVILDLYTKLVSSLVWTSEEGALTELYLGVATEDIQEKQLRGKYFHPQSVEVVNPYAENEELQENVWQLFEGLVEKFL